MRQIAIVDGHPDPSDARLNHALAQRYAEAARAAGHEVRRIQVASLDFPLLRIPEDFYSQQPPEAIRAAQRDLAWADHWVFFYPLWHGDMPALLKAFIEQTFRPGFALEYGGGMRFPKRLLAGKSARIVVTMGMPAVVYRSLFGAHSLLSFKRGTLQMAGVRPVRTTLLGGAGDGRRERWLDLMATLAERDGTMQPQQARRLTPAGAAAALTLAAIAGVSAAALQRRRASRDGDAASSETEREPHVLEESIAHARLWLRDVNAGMGGWMSEDYALAALRAGLQALREHLTVDQSAHLSAQLPTLVRGIYYEAWAPARVPLRERSDEQIFGSVMEHFRGKMQTPDPREVLRAVFAVVHANVSSGESRKVFDALPQAVRRYWPAQTTFEEIESAPRST